MAINSVGSASTVLPLPAAGQGSVTAPASAAAVKVEAAAPVQSKADPEQVQKAMKEVQQAVEATSPNSLQFAIDHDSGKTVVKITDVKTGELIRQIPSEEMLELARSLDKMQGKLLQLQG